MFRIMLQVLGSLFAATLAHELYHAVTGSVSEVGIRFGRDGGFFTEGQNLGSEPGAYVVTFLVFFICLFLSFADVRVEEDRW